MSGFQFTTTNFTPEARDRCPEHTLVASLARTLRATLVLAALVFAAGPVAAGSVTGESPSPRRDSAVPTARAAQAAKPAETAHARVSTSPDENTATATPSQTNRQTGDADDATPLTRAAARRRVESISPVPWLTRFGQVSLERRE